MSRWNRLSPATRFAITFAVLSSMLLGFYYYPYAPDTWVKHGFDGYLRGYAAVAGGVLHWFEPSLIVSGQDIVGRYSLRIVRTCDAMDVQILFLSAVLAWPAPWRRRAIAAVVGCVGLFAANVARICSLYYVGLVFPSSFDLVHLELWPALIVVLAVGAFVAFTVWARTDPAGSRHEIVAA